MANLLPPAKSAIVKQNKSAIIKADKFIGSSKVKDKTTKIRTPKKPGQNLLLSIEKKVIKIDKLLKTSLELKKKGNEKQRKGKESGSFEEKEKELEKKKQPKVKGITLPSAPKLGIFDWIKNFIFNTLLGFIAIRLIDHLPKLKGIFTTVMKVGEFIIDIGGKLLDGLITFIDWGYKAIDGTRSFIKQLGGEGLAQNFDKIAGAIDNVIEVAIIAALATADSGVGGDLMDLGGDFIKDRLLQKGAQQAVQTGAQQVAGQAAGTVTQAGGIGVAGVTGIVAGVGLLASALGEGAFQLRKIATKPIQDAKKAYDNEKNPLMKMGRGAFLTGISTLLGPLSAIGVLLDVIGAPFRYAIELLRFPFLSEEDKQKQAYNLAKLDARIREDFRKALNMVTLGFAFKEKGSFGNIYGNKGAQNEMMSKMASGGTPGRKPVTRSFKRKKKKARTFIPVPKKIKPGKNTGGDKKIQSVFPNPEKPEGFLGWLQSITGGGQQQQQTSKKPSEKSANPQEFLVKSNDVLGKANFFGPFFTLALKSVLGDKPGKLDYVNVGKGLNAWMQTTLKSGSLGFAGGGEVDAKQFFQGEDYSEVIAKSVEDSVSGKVDQTIRDLAKELSLRPVGKEEMRDMNMKEPDKDQDPSLDVGPGGTVTGGNADFWTLVAISRMEDSDPQGSADVAQSIYNRVASGIYGGKTIKEIVLRQGQYEPTWKYPTRGRTGVPNPEWHGIKDLATASKATGISQGDLQKTAAALRNSKYQEEARKFIGGRTDFMGGSNQPGPGDIRRKGNEPNNFFGWFVGPAARAYGAKNPGPAKAPQLGDIVVMGGGGGTGGGGVGGKTIVEIGKELLKQKFNVAEHPDFSKFGGYTPGRGVVTNVHKGRGHYEGRALDVTDWTSGYPGRYSTVASSLQKNSAIKMLIHDNWGFYKDGRKSPPGGHGHPTHLHVETKYEKGGETLDGPHTAMVGEKGAEYVIDADSYKATEKVAPGLLDILNYNVNDKASLQKNMPSIIASLSKYTSYEDQSETIVVLDDAPEMQMNYALSSPSVNISMESRGIDNKDFETLEML